MSRRNERRTTRWGLSLVLDVGLDLVLEVTPFAGLLSVLVGGIGVLVNGKFLYVVCQGMVQVSVIFVVAWLVYGVDLPGNLGPWLVISLAACIACAAPEKSPTTPMTKGSSLSASSPPSWTL